MGRLFGFGTAALDFRITTADLGTDYRAKLLARETRILGGGAIANSLHQAALLGTEVQWLGKIGADTVGSTIIRQLSNSGVGTDFVVTVPDGISPFNLAVYAGENQRRVGGFLLPNCLTDIEDADIDRWSAAVSPGDCCLVEVGELPLTAAISFCTAAKKRDVSIVIDVDLDPVAQCGATRDVFEELLACGTIVMPNYDALHSIYGEQSPAEMAKTIQRIYDCQVVITAGAEGCYYTDGETIKKQPPPNVAVVDTVGAGDAFHGGFLWSFIKGGRLPEAVKVGNACGAANCRVFGAREGMLNRAGLAEFIERSGYG